MPTKRVTKRRTSARSQKLAELVKQYLGAIARGKKSYAEADEALESLLLECQPGEPIEFARGRTARVKDQFAGTNKIFRPTFCPRYSIEVD